jgi:hypothetical protein
VIKRKKVLIIIVTIEPIGLGVARTRVFPVKKYNTNVTFVAGINKLYIFTIKQLL